MLIVSNFFVKNIDFGSGEISELLRVKLPIYYLPIKTVRYIELSLNFAGSF